jgi:hypothetical protein
VPDAAQDSASGKDAMSCSSILDNFSMGNFGLFSGSPRLFALRA